MVSGICSVLAGGPVPCDIVLTIKRVTGGGLLRPLDGRCSRLTLNVGKQDIALGQRMVYREFMPAYTAVIEKCSETGLFVGFVPGFPGAHSQGDTLDELHSNLRDVITMLIEDGEPPLEAEYIGTQLVTV
jgi:predicted RNase H-like HicB family nuclease